MALLRHRRRAFVLCTLLLVCIASVAPAATIGRAASPVTLTFWQSNNPQEARFTKALVDRWNKAHRDIQIKLQYIPAGKSTEEVLAAAIAAHKTPDITNNLLPAVVPQYSGQGGLYQLDKLPDFVSYMTARMPQGMLEQYGSSDGHYYQVPWKGNPVMIVYRPDLLRKAGITSFPRTYSSFLKALEAIKSRTGVTPIWPAIDPTWWQRFFDFYPFYLAQSGGTPLLNKSASKAVFQERGATRVMDLWRQIYERKLAPKSAYAGNIWKSGRVAMYIAGPWGPADQVLNHNAGKVPWAVAPIPVPDGMTAPGYPYTFSDPKNITIFATSKHPKEAWQFIKWYINRENDAAFLKETWEFPFRTELVENPQRFSPLFRQYPQLVPFAKQLSHVRGLDDSPSFTRIFQAVSDAWASAVVNGSKSTQGAVKDAAAQVNSIVQSGP